MFQFAIYNDSLHSSSDANTVLEDNIDNTKIQIFPEESEHTSLLKNSEVNENYSNASSNAIVVSTSFTDNHNHVDTSLSRYDGNICLLFDIFIFIMVIYSHSYHLYIFVFYILTSFFFDISLAFYYLRGNVMFYWAFIGNSTTYIEFGWEIMNLLIKL